MCMLIVVRTADPEFPLLVGSNRDEHRERKAAPPGLWVADQERMLSPRDRRGGGTWLAISASHRVAGLTNRKGHLQRELPTTRGELPHLALDAPSIAAGIARVRARIADEPFNPFQLVVADADHAAVLLHGEDGDRLLEPECAVLVATNEHACGELALPGAERLVEAGLTVPRRLERLRKILLDEGELTGHRVLKKGGAYGTVSSSLIAVPGNDWTQLVWRYAAGEPGSAPYRNYGNLGKRLLG